MKKKITILVFGLLVSIATIQAQSWTQIGSDIDGEAANDFSGSSVSLSFDGTTVAIGATHNDGNGSDAGHVRIFRYSNGTWTQTGNDIDGEAAYDYFGHSVSFKFRRNNSCNQCAL